jgi:hypothetical protein
VPELMGILGVEVPDPPQVSLAGIKADAITLHWTRPGPSKPVVKYLIQVNGVNGEASHTHGESARLTLYSRRIVAIRDRNHRYRIKAMSLLQCPSHRGRF